MTVTIAKKDVADGYNETLSQYVKQVQIPGFRKGHVPAKVLERKFGAQINSETISDLIDKSLNEIFKDESEKENRPLPYEPPRLEKMPELDFTKDLEYTVTYDVFPKVEVKNFDGIEVKVPEVSVGDEEVAEELKALQYRNAVVVDKKDETVAKDDIITIDIFEKDENGTEIKGTRRVSFVFTVGTAENVYKIDDELCGMKKGETKDISKTYGQDDENESLAGKTKSYSVTVKEVKVRDLPALDNDFAEDVNEKFHTLDELKEDIKKQLNRARDRRVNEVKNNSLLLSLIEKNPFDIPASMLRAELENRWGMMAHRFQTNVAELERLVVSSGQSKEKMLEQWSADAELLLKSRIIVDTLMNEKNISVSAEEVEAKFKSFADENGISIDDVKKHYEDPKAKEYFVDDLKEQKLYDELFKLVKVEKGENVKFADLFKNQ